MVKTTPTETSFPCLYSYDVACSSYRKLHVCQRGGPGPRLTLTVNLTQFKATWEQSRLRQCLLDHVDLWVCLGVGLPWLLMLTVGGPIPLSCKCLVSMFSHSNRKETKRISKPRACVLALTPLPWCLPFRIQSGTQGRVTVPSTPHMILPPSVSPLRKHPH